MRLSVLGAGAIGPAAAALAAARGHDVVLWSPSGRGTAGIADRITAEGALDCTVPVRIASDLAGALQGAEAALLAVPAYAHASLLPSIAKTAPPGLTLLIAPAAALAPLAFDGMRAALGPRAPVGALATAPVTARRIAPDRVRIASVRQAVDVAALPASESPEVAALATALFGHACPIAPNVLHPALANANPIIHAVLALVNATRIERAEAWPQYEMMTPSACALMLALQAERDHLAAAFGLRVLSLAEALHRASGIPLRPLQEMGPGLAAAGRSVAGPNGMETRYVTEDVPHGLAFYLWLAARRDIAMPQTEATVTLLETLWQRDLRHAAPLGTLDTTDLALLLRTGVGRM